VDQPISAMDAGSLDTQTVTPDAQTNEVLNSETESGKSFFLNYILFYLLYFSIITDNSSATVTGNKSGR
jgi:hypothetical protein